MVRIKHKTILGFLVILEILVLSTASAADYKPKDYVWTTQSRNSSESMPCGGFDVGMNVWVEDGDVLFYVSQSGWFDENNTLLKAGRWRLHFETTPFNGSDFRQTLSLDEGCIYIEGGGTKLRLWADVEVPMVFVEIHPNSPKGQEKNKGGMTLSYENWRYEDRLLTKAECQQSSYKWVLPEGTLTRADSVVPYRDQLNFYHQNRSETVFDFTTEREGLQPLKNQIYNPIADRLMGGKTDHIMA